MQQTRLGRLRNAFSDPIRPVLAQGQLRRIGLAVSIEGDDGVDNCKKEIAFAFRKDFEPR
jgi:hypothetical protein